MRSVLAALLLSLQLQPLLGSAACLGLIRQPGQEHCSMPEHGPVPVQAVADGLPHSSQDCGTAALCTPAQLGVPAVADQLARVSVLSSSSAASVLDSLTDVTAPPPLPPPRA